MLSHDEPVFTNPRGSSGEMLQCGWNRHVSVAVPSSPRSGADSDRRVRLRVPCSEHTLVVRTAEALGLVWSGTFSYGADSASCSEPSQVGYTVPEKPQVMRMAESLGFGRSATRRCFALLRRPLDRSGWTGYSSSEYASIVHLAQAAGIS